jgi:Holliday junction resolvase
MKEIYKIAGINYINRTNKRTARKRKIIIKYIKNNPLATQREINKNCKTRVQGLFNQGIFGAYEASGIKFPFQRLRIHGCANKETKKRAKIFEGEIAKKLSCFGLVDKLIKLKRGVADIILERKGKKAIIEVKDYWNKEISKSEIEQLNKYLEDSKSNLGFLVCHIKPKKDRFLIGENELIVLTESELNKIPETIDKG